MADLATRAAMDAGFFAVNLARAECYRCVSAAQKTAQVAPIDTEEIRTDFCVYTRTISPNEDPGVFRGVCRGLCASH